MHDFTQATDGIDHINVYSKSRSTLGQLLSNFAHTPITLNGQLFESIESWWYWTKMNNVNASMIFPFFTNEQLEEIKSKVGREAKEFFKSLYEDESFTFNPTKEEVKTAYMQKLVEHPEIKELLIQNTLPITHYYMMFQKQISADSMLWTATLWEEIKNDVNLQSDKTQAV